MAVAVFPRLGELLRERNLTVADLERQIEQRFGGPVNRSALDQLSESEPVRQADLEAAGAAASVLGVGFGELFFVVDLPPGFEELPSFLEPDQSRRLADLLDRQDYEELSPAEQSELETLVEEHARRWRDHTLGEVARMRGVSVEQAHADSDASIAAALDWYRELQADPERLRKMIAQAKRRAARASA